MRNVYLNQIVDISDPHCEFIKEFNREIHKYGAIVYNLDYNSYQFIRNFEEIDYKKEIWPDLIKVENYDVLKGLKITVHYEFDPEEEEDQENLDIWKELKETEIPVYKYDEDGELEIDKMIKLDTKTTTHIVWFLKPESFDYILDMDLLMLMPIIKNVNISRTLISQYGIHPFETSFDMADIDSYQVPDVSYFFKKKDDSTDDQ